MSQKKEKPFNLPNEDHISRKDSNPTPNAAFNALAAAYSLSPSAYSPFYPYPMMPFGIPPGFHPNFAASEYFPVGSAFPYWPNALGADYLLNMATLQNLQSPTSSMSASSSSAFSNNSQTESFSDVLRKIPRPPSISSLEKHPKSETKLQNRKEQSGRKSTDEKPSKLFPNLTGSTNLDALAQVASCLQKTNNDLLLKNANFDLKNSKFDLKNSNFDLKNTNFDSSESDSNANSANFPPRLTSSSTLGGQKSSKISSDFDVLDFSKKKRQHFSSVNEIAEGLTPPKLSKIEQLNISNVKKFENFDQPTSNTKHRHVISSEKQDLTNRKNQNLVKNRTPSDNNCKKANNNVNSNIQNLNFTGNSSSFLPLNNLSSEMGDLKMDPNLLNASAMAWAALSNQFLLAAAASSTLQQQQNNDSKRFFNDIGLSVSTNGTMMNANCSQSGPKTFSSSLATTSSTNRTYSGAIKSHVISTNTTKGTISSSLSGLNNKLGVSSLSNVKCKTELPENDERFNGKIVVDCAPKDTLDDTINAVIRSKMAQAQAMPKLSYRSSRHHHHHQHAGRPRKRGLLGLSGVTVREQLALRRACEETGAENLTDQNNPVLNSANDDVIGSANDPTCSVLDLSFKQPQKQHQQTIEIRAEPTISNDLDLPKLDDESLNPLSKKRTLPETELVRVPLEKGWRRQTCIRSISASGIRGDVIYYAPCGRRLGSYAEVVRYMNKNKIRDIGREHFSFSCKVLVGEFLHVRPDSAKNGILPLSESEVREMVNKFQQAPVSSMGPCSSKSLSVLTNEVSCRPRLKPRVTTARKRGRPATGGVPLYNANFKQKDLSNACADNDNQENSVHGYYNTRSSNPVPSSSQPKVQKRNGSTSINKLTPEDQSKKEDEIRKNQFDMLRKQEEEYMRQVMILTDWEREKNRQQVLFARALDASRRQEKRKQIYAEKLIREEERIAARNAYLQKIKQQRIPVDDLEVIDPKPLPELERIDNLQLDGQSFADLLMVTEFVHNFGHVLKISSDDIPSVDSLHAGLFNDKRHVRHLLNLAKILLMLVLEYPGLPVGQYSKTFLGSSAKDVSVNYDNLSELMRIFFRTRGSEGLKLAQLLETNCFEALTPSDKVSMLAFMCNELLYCRNVVREIEANIDLSAKLKSDKWTVEGRHRHLKAIQASKQCNNAAQTTQKSAEGPKPDDNQTAPVAENGKKKSDCEDDETLDKVRLKIIAESEPLSAEEKNMSAEEVNKEVDSLVANIEDVNSKILEANSKVRILPFGQDRYHRFYWSLPRVKGVLVESLESVGPKSHVISPEIESLLVDDREKAQIVDCLRHVVNLVAEEVDGSDEPMENMSRDSHKMEIASCDNDKKEIGSRDFDKMTYLDNESNVFTCKKRKMHLNAQTLGPPVRRGWWLIRNKEKLDHLQQSFNNRGIRERHLGRVFDNKVDIIRRAGLDQDKTELFPSRFLTHAKNLTVESINMVKLQKVMQKVRDLEEKIYLANVHVKTWKPPDSSLSQDDDFSSGDENSDDFDESKDADACSMTSEFSSDGDNFVYTGNKWNKKFLTVDKFTDCKSLSEIIRKRTFDLEQNIERRYLDSDFYKVSNFPFGCSLSNNGFPESSRDTSRRNSLVAASDISDEVGTSSGTAEVTPASESVVMVADEDDNEEGVPPALRRWRVAVSGASTPAQFVMCLEFLNSHIAWERSVMKASCQICRRGDDDSHLLLCDGCDLGYHTYCFKPKMETIPVGDWFCPECVSQATRRLCCLLCCRQTARPMLTCADCQRNFHCDCVSQKKIINNWKCDGCNSIKNNSETIKKLNSSISSSTVNKKLFKRNLKNRRSSKLSGTNKSAMAATQGKRNHCSGNSGNAPKTEKSNHQTTTTLDFTELCSILLAELDAHNDSWPFKLPVDTKVFPLYKKIIKRPFDLSLIQSNLDAKKYENANQFISDVKQMFDNCKTFNEDDSPVGKAGHSLRRFFNKRWKELKEMTSTPSKK